LFSISFNPSDLKRWFTALARVERTIRFHAEDMQRRCALEYKILIAENLISNRYAMSYPRYNRRYADWKYRTLREAGYAAGGYWDLTRTLVRSIGIRKVKAMQYHSGITPGAMAPSTSWFSDTFGTGRSVEVDFYAKINEFGGRRHPARPVFTPTMFEYASNKWLGQALVSMRSIQSKWR